MEKSQKTGISWLTKAYLSSIVLLIRVKYNYGIKMRATEYKDGIKRIKAKIEVPMSELDVGNYVLSALTHNVVNLAQIQKLNKRELLQLAKEEVKEHGIKSINIDSVENDTKVIVRNYIKQMFPELQ